MTDAPEPWRLTDDDETSLHLASIRGTTAEVVYTREELHSAVESIKEAAWRAGQVAGLTEAWEAYSGKPVGPQNPIQPLFVAGFRAARGEDAP